MLDVLIMGAFFCYGMFTIQRSGFLLENLPNIWKKFPQKLHEPLFSCGVCVSSIWGLFFIVFTFLVQKFINTEYQLLAKIPLYIISFGGVCALIDRAVKSFEYNYKYNYIKPLSNYSYLENYEFRNSMIDSFIQNVLNKKIKIIEIGGFSESIASISEIGLYQSFDKHNMKDIINSYIQGEYFILIKGIAFEGNFQHLINLLDNAKGFIVEGSLSGVSGKQLNWIIDNHKGLKRIPYMTSEMCESPTHCGGDINNRIILIKTID